jgi:ABC-2 type transport system permease protein
MSPLRLVAKNDLMQMRRSRVAQLAVLILLALSAVAALTSVAHRNASDDLRARFQAQADSEFDGQPARHPHRMVHYGHFVFRPLPALAAFDPGVDGFTGNTIFLEGHRQNSANFGDVRQSSLLARFGQLTPAFVLQALAPLVLIFIGFGAIAREREQGTLRVLTAHGVEAHAVMAGKAAALGIVASIMLAPAALSLGWLAIAADAPLLPAITLLAFYAAYLTLWVLAIVTVSSLCGQARGALIALLGLWTFTTILLPRIAPDVAVAAAPLPTRLETDIAIQRDLRQIGDSHNPDDPYYAEFKANVLRQYAVDDIADLPLNFSGLVAMEGEKLTSRLFDRYAERQSAEQRRQGATALAFGLLSPAIALRDLSMAAAGTDLEGHRRFLTQAEAYRFNIVQRLNRLQAEAVTYSDDRTRNTDPEAARRVRIDPSHWHEVPDFTYRAATTGQQLRAAAPGMLLVFGWLLATMIAFRLAARRLAGAL